MSRTHRLQVMFDEAELEAHRRAASADGMTVSEWVRSTLRDEQRRRNSDRTREKLAALQRALGHDFPAPGIDQMLEEISCGRGVPAHRDALD